MVLPLSFFDCALISTHSRPKDRRDPSRHGPCSLKAVRSVPLAPRLARGSPARTRPSSGEGTFPTGDPSSQSASFADKELGISSEGTLPNFPDRSRECGLTSGPSQRRRAGGRRDELQPWQSSKPRFYGSHTAQFFGCFCVLRHEVRPLISANCDTP